MAERDFRQELTDKFVAALDEGKIPWERPWDEVGIAARPRNAISGHEYTGANRMVLTLTQLDQKYDDPRWLTFNQARNLGGGVEKGQKGTPIEFWSEKPFYTRKDVDISLHGAPVKVIGEKDGAVMLAGNRTARTGDLDIKHDSKNYGWGQAERKLNILVSQVHTLFNVEQCRDLDIKPFDKGAEKPGRVFTPVERGEQLMAAMAKDGVRFAEAPNRAFYQPMADSISLPPREHFKSPEAFYGTALHECGHATGHESRLNRSIQNPFGSIAYAKEELVAEMTSAFLAAETGIPRDLNDHKAYIQSWADVLRNDKNELFRAAKQAGLAADYMIAKEQALAIEVSAEYVKETVRTDHELMVEHERFLEHATIGEAQVAIDQMREQKAVSDQPEPEEIEEEMDLER